MLSQSPNVLFFPSFPLLLSGLLPCFSSSHPLFLPLSILFLYFLFVLPFFQQKLKLLSLLFLFMHYIFLPSCLCDAVNSLLHFLLFDYYFTFSPL